MLVGAILMLATFSISFTEAFNSIDFRVIEFLFGMLTITAGFQESGLMEFIVISVLKRAKSINTLVFGAILGSGLLSAIFVNDTVAFLITPIAIGICSRVGLKNPRSLLIPIAFGITIGSTFTPIGNPQNLLVALNSSMSKPFAQFAAYLFVPSMISMICAYYLSRLFFRKEYRSTQDLARTREALPDSNAAISDMNLAKLSAGILIVLIGSFALIQVFPDLQSLGLTLNTLAFGAGVVLLVLSPKRLQLLRTFNWGILIFFAGMFIVMRAVWDSNVGSVILSILPTPQLGARLESTAAIMFNSVTLSQILSNVPFVQLYSYELSNLTIGGSNALPWLALAAGSTLAGNLSLLGAVSNVIIVESAEEKGARPFSFFEFLRYGIVVTIVTFLIFLAFLAFA